MLLSSNRGPQCVLAALVAAAGLSASTQAQTLSLTTLDTCYNAGETTVTVAVDLTASPVDVVGGQFFLQYDAAVLQFVSAEPGDAPFDFQIHETVDAVAGTINYATGVDPFDNPPPPGVPAGRMAVLTFTAVGEVCDAAGLVAFRANEPATTVTDDTGADLLPTLADLPAITIDAAAPSLSGVPADVIIECNDPVPSPATPTASDACDPAPMVTFDEVTTPGACPNASTITRTWTATDACGNTTTGVQVITIVDSTAPVLTPPADITLECGDDASPGGLAGQATATDNCDAAPTVTHADTVTPGSCEGASVITREWIAEDACGNVATAVQTITILDTTPPAVIPPADAVVECGGDTTPASTGSATYVDCDNAAMVSFDDVSTPGDCPQETVIVRTWTVVDACGNIGTADQTITVTDTTAPVLTIPADISVECGSDLTPAGTGQATATDNCDGAPVVTYSDVSNSMSCPEVITRTWSAEDVCGNIATAVQTITVTDNTAPAFTFVPSDLTVECGDSTAPSETGQATATDNCGEPIITFEDVAVPGACPGEQTITRTWTASDACGLTVTADQVITVVDTTAPVVTAPADLTLECGDDTDPAFTGTATATDACDTAPVVTYSDVVTATCGNTTVITRTWSATDVCGQVGTADQIITLEDTTPPVFDAACPLPAVTVVADAGTCTASAASVGLVPPAATDTCGEVTVTGSRSDGLTMADPFPSDEDVTVTWTATDACGNTAACEQLVTVEPVNEVVIDLELETGFEAGPFTRCITFQLFACAPSFTVETVTAPVTFTSGSGQVTIQIPCGEYTCITARDSLHTLRQTDNDDFGVNPIVGSVYVANFTASGAGGDDDRLVGGNLNDDLVVDILDFGTFIGRFSFSDPADTTCPPTGINADINGDGAVFVEDFNFIFVNFLGASENNCCGQPGLVAPVQRISVAELIDTGRAHLAVADLNNDGWLDADDMAAYLNGALVRCPADINGDHAVDVFDLLAYLDSWFAGDAAADMNADDYIDNFDLLGYLDLWFAGC